jgi:hypothetical protein
MREELLEKSLTVKRYTLISSSVGFIAQKEGSRLMEKLQDMKEEDLRKNRTGPTDISAGLSTMKFLNRDLKVAQEFRGDFYFTFDRA